MANLTSATIAAQRLMTTLEAISYAITDNTISYEIYTNRIQQMKYEARIEADRQMYLHELCIYTGHRITSFADLKNI